MKKIIAAIFLLAIAIPVLMYNFSHNVMSNGLIYDENIIYAYNGNGIEIGSPKDSIENIFTPKMKKITLYCSENESDCYSERHIKPENKSYYKDNYIEKKQYTEASGHKSFLKYIIKNNVVSAIEGCFLKDSMFYCLKLGEIKQDKNGNPLNENKYHDYNKKILLKAFKNSGCIINENYENPSSQTHVTVVESDKKNNDKTPIVNERIMTCKNKGYDIMISSINSSYIIANETYLFSTPTDGCEMSLSGSYCAESLLNEDE